MKRVLDLKFVKADSKKVSIQISDVKETVDPAKVNALMDFIVSKNIFSFKGVSIAKKDGAALVNTDTENITLV